MDEAKFLSLGEYAEVNMKNVRVFSAVSNLEILMSEIDHELGFRKDELELAKKRILDLENKVKVLTSQYRMPRPENSYQINMEVLDSFPESARSYMQEAEACYNFGFYKAAACMLGNAFEAILNAYFKKKGWELSKEVNGKKKPLSYEDKFQKIDAEMKTKKEKAVHGQLVKLNTYLRCKANHPSGEGFGENIILGNISNLIEINNWMNKH